MGTAQKGTFQPIDALRAILPLYGQAHFLDDISCFWTKVGWILGSWHMLQTRQGEAHAWLAGS